MTNAGALLGTPAIHAAGARTGGVVDARADLYSLGCVLYTALTAGCRFDQQRARADCDARERAGAADRRGAGRPLHVVERLLAKEPSGRYPDAASVREALEAALSISNEVVEVAEPTLVAGSATILGLDLAARSATPVGRPARSATPVGRPARSANPVGGDSDAEPGVAGAAPEQERHTDPAR